MVADHIRTLTMAITDGAAPSNTGRGYVLRRILRRTVVENMKDAFPELEEKMHFVQEVILDEELSFNRKWL